MIVDNESILVACLYEVHFKYLSAVNNCRDCLVGDDTVFLCSWHALHAVPSLSTKITDIPTDQFTALVASGNLGFRKVS